MELLLITGPAGVVYVMLDLKRRRQDVRAFVAALESVIISSLDSMNVRGKHVLGQIFALHFRLHSYFDALYMGRHTTRVQRLQGVARSLLK